MTASADLESAAAAVARFPAEAVRRATTSLRDAILPQLARDTGGDYRLSGVGPTRLAVSTKVTGTVLVEGRVSAGPKKMRGPWRWLEDGTRPRTTATGARHPGTRPKNTFTDPTTKALPDVERRIMADFDAIIR